MKKSKKHGCGTDPKANAPGVGRVGDGVPTVGSHRDRLAARRKAAKTSSYAHGMGGCGSQHGCSY